MPGQSHTYDTDRHPATYIPASGPYKQVREKICCLTSMEPPTSSWESSSPPSSHFAWTLRFWQTGAWSVSYLPGGSPYKQVPGQSVIYLVAVHTNRCQVSQLYTWWQSIQTGARSVSYIPGGSLYKQVPGQSVIYLVAVYTNRCQVSQLCTWWQSIQTGAWSISYIPNGSPYRLLPSRTMSRSVAKPRRMAGVFAACSLTPLFLHDQRQHYAVSYV